MIAATLNGRRLLNGADRRTLRLCQSARDLPLAARLAGAACIVVVAVGVQFALLPSATQFPFATYFPAVLLAGVLFGPLPTLVTTAISAGIASLLWTRATPGAGIPSSLATVLAGFLTSGVLVSYLSHVVYKSITQAVRIGLRLHHFHAESHFGLVLTDLDGNFLDYNLAFESLLGAPGRQLTSLRVADVTPHDRRAVLGEHLQALYRKGHFGPFDTELLRRDGERIPVRIQGALYGSRADQPLVWSIVEDISREHEHARNLEALLAEQRAVIESPAVGIARVSDGRFVWSNAAFAAMLGYDTANLSGRATRLVFVSDEALDAHNAQVAAALAAGRVFRAEEEWVRADGGRIWVLLSIAAFGDGRDERFGISIDITASKRAAEAVAAGELRMNEAQRLAHVGSWELDHVDDRLSWSAEMFRLYGIPPQASGPARQRWLDAIHPADRERTNDAIAAAVSSGAPLDLTHRTILPDRSQRQLHVTATTQYSSQGDPLRTIGAAQDVTAVTAYEESLRLAEARVRTIFAAMREGLVLHGRNGEVTQANPAACRILGLDLDQLLGRTAMDPRWSRIREDGTPYRAHEHPAMRSLQSGVTLSDEIMGVRMPGGEMRWISINSVPLGNTGGGAAEGVVVTFADITERRQLEQEIRQLAFHDPLTGLPTRRLMDDRLGQAIASSERSGEWAALMVLDLDHFKAVNDAHGHAAGDLLLKEAGARLQAGLRRDDTVARLGGDEFVIVATGLGTSEVAALATARDLAAASRRDLSVPYFLSGTTCASNDAVIRHVCSASVGVVVFRGAAIPAADLMNRADAAMYEAKRAGRDRAQVLPACGGTAGMIGVFPASAAAPEARH